MMKLKKFLALLCALVMCVCMFGVGCTPNTGILDGDNSSVEKPSDDEKDDPVTPSDDEKDDSVTPSDDEKDDPVTPPDDGQDDPVTPPDDEKTAVMPRIDIKTDDGKNSFATDYSLSSKSQIEYVSSKVSVSNCDEKYELQDIECQVKARGNYTLNYAKKPIRLKFNKKQKMLGLNGDEKFKSWVLLAEYKDDSLLRNSTVLYLGQKLLVEDGYYSSDCCHVELYLNGQYWGVYLLAEQQQVDKERVNITKPEDADGNDYMGTDIGYLMEYDGYFNAEAELEKFTIDYNNFASVKRLDGSSFRPNSNPAPEGNEASDHIIGYTIKSDIYSKEQNAFVKSYLNNAYRLCYEAIYKNNFLAFDDTYTSLVSSSATTAEECISAAVDINSMVDSYMIQEIACDSDVAWSSFYMTVDFGAKGDKILRFEAPWDFDSALGNRYACESGKGMFAANNSNPWLAMFASQSWFNNKVKARWQSAKEAGVFDGALQQIDDIAAKYSNYFKQNIERWGYMNVRGELCWSAQQCANQAESAAYLKKWLNIRFSYLDAVWGNGDSANDKDVTGVRYRVEAENCAVTGGIGIKSGNNASGNGYLGNVAGGANKTISFTVTVNRDVEVSLYIGLSKRNQETSLSEWFMLKVNSKEVSIPFLRTVLSTTGDGWHDWTGIKMANISLKQGSNTIVIATVANDATNVDYFEFISPVALSFK